MKQALMVFHLGNFINFELNDIKILTQMGYQVSVATNFKGFEYLKEKLKPYGTNNYQIDFDRFPLSLKNIKAYKQLKKIMNNNDFSLVHCHSPIGSVIARLVAKPFRKKGTCKVIYTPHGFHFYKGAPILNWMLYYPVEKFLSKYTDTLITITKEDYQLAKAKFYSKRIEYINGIGIDLEKFNDKKLEEKNLRKELKIEDDKIILLSVGEFTKNKNHISVIKALKFLNNPNIMYLIAGEGILKDKLINFVHKLGLSNQVKFLGFIKGIKDYYKIANAFVFPSLREGLSVALMEAMASGVPILCSNIRGNTDLIDNPKGGLLFNPQKTEDIAEKIKIFLQTDKQTVDNQINYNLQKIKNFDIKNIEIKMKEIYSSLEIND